jgi:hypothetical protein
MIFTDAQSVLSADSERSIQSEFSTMEKNNKEKRCEVWERTERGRQSSKDGMTMYHGAEFARIRVAGQMGEIGAE